jgi:predicted RNA-binding protein with PUA-like domain
MAYFLLKTEPSVFSLSDLARLKKTVWDGVSNNLALKYLRTMKKGDETFIYHTGEEKQIVGIARIISNPYPDPKLNDPKLTVVDIAYESTLPKPVPLSAVKALKELKDFPLVRLSRLSVMPVSSSERKIIMSMSK